VYISLKNKEKIPINTTEENVVDSVVEMAVRGIIENPEKFEQTENDRKE